MSPLTDDLIRDLVEDAPPVRRIARLRSIASLAIGSALLVAAVRVAIVGVRPDLGSFAPPVWLVVVLLGLAVASLGGLAAALGAAVPGREVVTRAGLAAIFVGVGFAVGTAAAPWALSSLLSPASHSWLADASGCIGTASYVGLPPALILAWYLRRAGPSRPYFALAAACGGAVGLGAVAVQSSCVIDSSFHVLVAHTLAPMLGGALLVALLALLVRFRAMSGA